MNGIKLKDKLSIILTTYNRSKQLQVTLDALKNSPIKDCRITILNNHSTDDTLDVCKKLALSFENFQVVTHSVNLGGGCENYIHAIDYCNTEYMWILSDDDTYDFSSFDDVEEEIFKANVNIIQVGAHNDRTWDWGICDTPKALQKLGYPFFKYSSFLPCTIFKYDFFVRYIKDAYDYIHYRYPHLPSIVSAYNNNLPIYVSKCRIVTATINVQTYSDYIPFRGMIMATKFLDQRDTKRMVLDTIFNNGKAYWFNYILSIKKYREEDDIVLVSNYMKRMMSVSELLIVRLLFYPVSFFYPYLRRIIKYRK